mmetsp:Transcript_34800/g.76029  ORF Transcript_34800/g.76029 Transcript_34800/m.76029 type:complete len:168 (+) Transcript_34800:103-606(+)
MNGYPPLAPGSGAAPGFDECDWDPRHWDEGPGFGEAACLGGGCFCGVCFGEACFAGAARFCGDCEACRLPSSGSFASSDDGLAAPRLMMASDRALASGGEGVGLAAGSGARAGEPATGSCRPGGKVRGALADLWIPFGTAFFCWRCGDARMAHPQPALYTGTGWAGS